MRSTFETVQTKPYIEFAWSGFQPRLDYALELLGCVTGYLPKRIDSVEVPSGQLWIRSHHERPWMCYEISARWDRFETDPIESGIGDSSGILFLRPESERPDWLLQMLWMSLRVEERGEIQRDEHGRFRASSSRVYDWGGFEIPWVHRWAKQLLKEWGISELPIGLAPPQVSVDIDHLLAYAGRTWSHTVLAAVRDVALGKFAKAKNRWISRWGGLDPYDTLEIQRQLWGEAPWNYFALIQLNRNRRDSGVDAENGRAQNLWRALDEALNGTLGWHPSTGASRGVDCGKMELEYHQVTEILRRPVIRSRFHFLFFQPEVHYPVLEQLGIKEDHSMGFADRMGWRAGVAVPYPWFDLKTNRRTDLWIHPFYAMDGHLLYYEKHKEPFNTWKMAQRRCARENVPFSWVTHWRMFSESDDLWKGWRQGVQMLTQKWEQ